MLIEIEKTPNPATRKFLPGRTVMEAGGRDFPNAEAAEASPLAEALFATGMVDGVFFGRDFVSVSAAPAVDWDAARARRARRPARPFHRSTRPCSRQGTAAGIDIATKRPAFEDDPADADIIDQIKELHRNPRPPGGRAGRRRHRLSRLQGRHALPRHAGRLLGLPVVGGHPEARHRRPDQTLRPRGRDHRSGLISDFAFCLPAGAPVPP